MAGGEKTSSAFILPTPPPKQCGVSRAIGPDRQVRQSMRDRYDADRVTFLVVDDDDVAVMAMRRAIRKLGLSNPVEVATDGEVALQRLRKGVERPFIVTLDLNMPRMNGLEFLAEVRRDPALQDTVIFVVTTSDAPKDVTSAYARNIAGYIVKEDTFETLKRALSMIREYTEVVRLPTTAGRPEMELRLTVPAQ